MKNLLLILVLSFIFLSCSPKLWENPKPTYVDYEVEMTLKSGRVITDIYTLPDTSTLFIRSRKGKSWLVYDSNRGECCPTILKNRVTHVFVIKKL
jgi:hypothetical protein